MHRDTKDAKAAVAAAVERFGRIDVLVKLLAQASAHRALSSSLAHSVDDGGHDS
jgi:hypothetical protein